jgi:DivIVA domain-containing protein
MTTADHGTGDEHRRLGPEDVHSVTFSRAGRMHAGYNDAEVDVFLNRVGEELARLVAENDALRDQVDALREQLASVSTPEPPSEQAVRILSTAQQTADEYVAEAEEFSRQMTTSAREQYEEQLRLARENAGAILQAAQEAAASVRGERDAVGGATADGGAAAGAEHPDPEALREQVMYLRAFGEATRTQLRAYLEALLHDVEAEWGRAHPAAVPPGQPRDAASAAASAPARTPATRADRPPSGTGPATVEAAAVLLSEQSVAEGRDRVADSEVHGLPR